MAIKLPDSFGSRLPIQSTVKAEAKVAAVDPVPPRSRRSVNLLWRAAEAQWDEERDPFRMGKASPSRSPSPPLLLRDSDCKSATTCSSESDNQSRYSPSPPRCRPWERESAASAVPLSLALQILEQPSLSSSTTSSRQPPGGIVRSKAAAEPQANAVAPDLAPAATLLPQPPKKKLTGRNMSRQRRWSGNSGAQISHRGKPLAMTLSDLSTLPVAEGPPPAELLQHAATSQSDPASMPHALQLVVNGLAQRAPSRHPFGSLRQQVVAGRMHTMSMPGGSQPQRRRTPR